MGKRLNIIYTPAKRINAGHLIQAFANTYGYTCAPKNTMTFQVVDPDTGVEGTAEITLINIGWRECGTVMAFEGNMRLENRFIGPVKGEFQLSNALGWIEEIEKFSWL